MKSIICEPSEVYNVLRHDRVGKFHMKYILYIPDTAYT